MNLLLPAYLHEESSRALNQHFDSAQLRAIRSARDKIVRRNVSCDTGRRCKRNPTPKLEGLFHTIAPNELRFIGQPQDHSKPKSWTSAQLQEFVGASSCNYRTAAKTTGTS